MRLGFLGPLVAAGALAALVAGGGCRNTAPEVGTLRQDVATLHWFDQNQSYGARMGHSMAYDPVGLRLLAFGGVKYPNEPAPGDGSPQVWDGSQWSLLTVAGTTQPGARYGSPLVSDGTSHLLLVSGGALNGAVNVNTYVWDGLQWNLGCSGQGALAGQCGAAYPGFLNHAVAYDKGRGLFVQFGGHGTDAGGTSDRTYIWNFTGTQGAWTAKCIPGLCTRPPERTHHSMAYDPVTGEVLLFGGCMGTSCQLTPSSALGDTWSWNGTRWLSRCPGIGCALSPPARWDHVLVTDDGTGRVVLIGGFDGTNVLGDTWEWDGLSWSQVQNASLTPRFQHAAAYDRGASRIIVYGGEASASSVLSDTWASGSVGGICSGGTDCASGFCVTGVCCDRQCDGPCEACGTGVCTPLPPGGSTACGLYACDGVHGTCPTLCTSDAVCAPGAYCNSSRSCVSQIVRGRPCDPTQCVGSGCQQCLNGVCSDKVCCDQACDGTCMSCRQINTGTGTDGTCAPVQNGTDPRLSCAVTGGAPSCAGTCDPTAVCQYPVSVCTTGSGQTGFCSNGMCAAAQQDAGTPQTDAGHADSGHQDDAATPLDAGQADQASHPQDDAATPVADGGQADAPAGADAAPGHDATAAEDGAVRPDALGATVSFMSCRAAGAGGSGAAAFLLALLALALRRRRD
jgi:MYXO-CTERM domain-containing protein